MNFLPITKQEMLEELLKSIDIGLNLDIEADLVKDLSCSLKRCVCGVVGGVTCNGEGVLKSVTVLGVDTVSILGVACCNIDGSEGFFPTFY